MKRYLFITMIGLIPFFSQAQSGDSKGRLGFTLNSSLNGELYPIRIVPSLTYLKGKSQFELGIGIHPFIRKDQRLVSGEFNYKFFPNGAGKKFTMYLITRLSYVHNPRDTYYPTTYNYLFLNAGYGFELGLFKGAFIGTNVSAGTFTYGKNSEVPYASFASKKLFDSFGYNLAFQFNIGYRF